MKKISISTLIIALLVCCHQMIYGQCPYEDYISIDISSHDDQDGPLTGTTINLGEFVQGQTINVVFDLIYPTDATCGPNIANFTLGGKQFLGADNSFVQEEVLNWTGPAPKVVDTANPNESFTLSFTLPSLTIDNESTYSRVFRLQSISRPGGPGDETLDITITADLRIPKRVITFIPGQVLTMGPLDEGTQLSAVDVGKNLTIQNTGNLLTLQIDSWTVVEETGTWIDIPNGTYTIQPNDPAPPNFNPTITADPILTAQATYRLLIKVHSNDPGSPQSILWEATGQPLTSNFQVGTISPFNPVVLPASDNRALNISNSGGDVPAEFRITQTNSGDPDWAYFTIWDESNQQLSFPYVRETNPLAVDASEEFMIVFEPADVGVFDVTINIAARDAGESVYTYQETREITAQGTIKPIDIALVLDKSGSMGQSAGEVIKMEALHNAACYFLDLLKGEAQNFGFIDYNFSILKFSTDNDKIYPTSTLPNLEIVNEDNIDDAKTLVKDLTAGSSTCIQDAIITAEGLLAEPDNNRAIIVFTDGNETPWVCDEVLPGLSADGFDEDIDFFSIGLGEDGNFSSGTLDQIASYGSGQGFSQITFNLEEENVFQLYKAFQDVFRIVSGKQGADPVYYRDLDETLEVNANITSQDQNVTFTFIGELPIEAYKIEIFTPGGRRVYPEKDTAVVLSQNWLIFHANYKNLDIENDYVGEWLIRARIETPKKWEDSPVFTDKQTHRMMVGYFGHSRYSLEPEVSEENILTGEPLVIRAKLAEKGLGVSGANIRARITAPGQEQHIIQLFDDGLHNDEKLSDGVYGAVFTNTYERGNYKIDIESTGATLKGEQVTRMESFSKFVGKITPYEKAPEQFPATYIIILAWVIIILLIIIWLKIRR